MDQNILIEDIIGTKNTLIILRQVFTVNRNSLEPFSLIFDSITKLINILTNSSAKQIETALLSSESNNFFKNLANTLNELSDAITTKNISKINDVNEQLVSAVQKLQLSSSYVVNNEDKTADDIFKKLLQSDTHMDNTPQPTASEVISDTLASVLKYNEVLAPLSDLEQVEKQMTSTDIDHFADFRFSSRRRNPSAPSKDKTDTVGPTRPTKSRLPMRAPITSRPTEQPLNKPRLMISYNHASKPLCVDIYERLTKDGYTVWIDFEQMHGNTLVAMAQGVESSDIFLYCVTENYSQSRSCQKEAEYAFVQQKIMIPLFLQSKYKPCGWLGLLVGTSLYIDFTKNDFTQNYAKLKSEIEANSMRISSNKNDVPRLTLNPTTNGQGQTHKETDNPSLIKTNSDPTVKKSRSCVLI
ncbi:unnamed protein product [Adineta steineri]|uniref:TIR domain-containing protein n=1 Tax=Adineta steineri TaxID=433720 RepID=A0A818SWB4_9BILA|nr:unnamed protein product [Adineta steineri]CAF3678605.1 unnamed protein product [Adineta steineri]